MPPKIKKNPSSGVDKETFKDAIVSAVILAFANMGDAFLYAYLPANYQQIGISTFWVGVILSVNRYVRLFLNGWIARVLSIKGIKTAVILAIILASITTSSYGLISAIPLWVLARVLWGISFSTLRLGNVLYALEHHRKGMALGLSRTLIESGPVIALFGGPFLLYYAGPKLTFLTFGLIGFAGFFLVLLLSDLKTGEVSKRDLILSFPSSFNILIVINAFITEGVLVVWLIRLLQYDQRLNPVNSLALVGLLLGYRRLSLVLFSTLSGWLADKWGFQFVYCCTTFLSAAGLLFILVGEIIPGIIITFTFSAMNTSISMGGILQAGNSFIKNVSDSVTWRDLGMATGTFAGALILPVSDIDLRFLVIVFLITYVIGLYYHFATTKIKK